MELSEILEHVKPHWPWTDEKYPGWKTLSEEERRIFRRKHILYHVLKPTHALIAAHEAADHGDASKLRDEAAMTEALGKLIVAALQYGDAAGLPPEKLEAWIRGYFPKEEKG